MEINKTNNIFHCTSCKNIIEPGQGYTHLRCSETRMVINEDGELETQKLDGYRIVCELCGKAYYDVLDLKIELP
jgi:hypothetical protein